MRKSSWEQTKLQSSYHFDCFQHDYRWDTLIGLGKFSGDWSEDLIQIIENSYPANWMTIDLEHAESNVGSIPEHAKINNIITHVNWKKPPIFLKMIDLFKLENVSSRFHIQKPGELLNLHLDRLGVECPQHPERIIRIMIQLTDRMPGQFFEFGNHQWNVWKAGDTATFDWKNVPHSSANTGHYPRVTLQLTGLKTHLTEKFLYEFRNTGEWII